MQVGAVKVGVQLAHSAWARRVGASQMAPLIVVPPVPNPYQAYRAGAFLSWHSSLILNNIPLTRINSSVEFERSQERNSFGDSTIERCSAYAVLFSAGRTGA